MGFEPTRKDPGVYVAQVPFAHRGFGHTNCYLVRDGGDARDCRRHAGGAPVRPAGITG